MKPRLLLSTWSIALLLGASFPARCLAENDGARRDVECRVKNVTADGVYVDAGSAAGIEVGDTGRVLRGAVEIATVEVESRVRSSARLRVVATRGEGIPLPGDLVVLFSTPPPIEEEGPEPNPADQNAEGPFVPLLTPPPKETRASPVENIFHGRLTLRQTLQADSENHLDYSRTRLGSRGSVDRIRGTPWSLEWSWDASYRDGHAFSGASGAITERFDLYRLALSRPLAGDGFLRLGRFLPGELPSVGYVDGAQLEKEIGDGLRWGALAGLAPRRQDLGFSDREPLAASYFTWSGAPIEGVDYSGTFGVLASAYEGSMDRLALLTDQRARTAGGVSLYWSSIVDFDVGGADRRSGAGLTQLDVSASGPITTAIRWRAGIDHYERPDNQAERDALSLNDDRFFDRGFWRYWVGSTQSLPGKFRLDEQVSFIDGPEAEDAPLWQVSATRTGILSSPNTQITLTAYNLAGADAEGYGLRLWGRATAMQGALGIQPSLGFRMLETDETNETFDLTDASLFVDWAVSTRWSTSLGYTQTFGDNLQSSTFSFDLSYRW